MASSGATGLLPRSHKDTRSLSPLERLPVEIQWKIYEYALKADGPIRVSRHKDTKGLEAAMQAWRSKLASAGSMRKSVRGHPKPKMQHVVRIAPIKVVGLGRRFIMLAETIALPLLRINKAVSEAARTVLYEQNRFIFEGADALEQFCKTIGSNVTMLADVDVQRCRLFEDRSSFIPLLDATKLRRLVLRPALRTHNIDDFVPDIRLVLEQAAPMYNHRSDCSCFGGCDFCSCISPEQMQRRLDSLIIESDYARVYYYYDQALEGHVNLDRGEEGQSVIRSKVRENWEACIDSVKSRRK